MRHAQNFMQRLKTTYLNFSLRSKISWALITSVSVVCGLVMLASYMNAYHLIIDHTHELLNSEAKLDKRELEIKLSAEIQSASEVANNFITANALADTEQSQLYLVPFLKNQKHAFKGTALSVLDYRGRLIAANLNQIIDYQVHPIFSRMMETGVLQASVHQNLHSEPVLMLAIPVQYRLSGEVEGGVVLEIPLNAVLQDKLENNFHWLEDINNKVVAGKKPILDDLLVSAKHEISLPIPEIKLAYYLAHDRERALQKINTMLIGYLGIALMAVLGLLAFARFSARYISEPLEYLSKVAQQVTSSGRPRSHINIQSKDEYGALAKAFNTMFVRLDEVYQSLEGRVKLRTQELEKAKADAEAARNLLNEAVANAIHGFCIFNQEDKLVVCNEAYRQFTQLGDYIEIGRSYEEILTKQVEQKVFPDSIGREQAWIAQRMQHHLKADASFVEVKRADNRWFMAQEVRSPSGYLIASRIDITEFKRVTDALTQRELYLQATLDNLPFLFWLKDAQSRLLAINKVYAEACDLDRPEDAVGKTEFDLWPPAIAERLHADDDEVIANMREKTTEQIIDEKYGLSWLEIYKKPVMTEDGKVMGTVGFARDITDRKNVELALAEAEMRWSLAMHGANDGVWDWNLQTNQVFYSERWKTMLGFEDEEVGDAADEWQLRVHPDDLQRSLDLVQAHLKGETEFYYNEHRLRCKDGSYKWILARGKALIGSEGKAVRLSGSHTDVSDKKLAEAIIIDRTQQLDEIFALSPDGFVSFDKHGQCKYANPAFLELTNLEANQLVGSNEATFSDLLAQQCKPSARFMGVAALRAKLSEWADADKNQALASDSFSGQIVELAGLGNRLLEISLKTSKAETVSEILYVRDVTHEVEVSRIKSDFLSTAAHELRTPMSSIYGYSELLLARKFSEQQQREFHEIIHKQATMVSDILNELLDLQRIESRRGKDFVIAQLDISQLITETVNMFKIPPGRSSPLISLPKKPIFIRADRSKMIQVINNVLSNAYKYSPQGGDVEIEVLADKSAAKNDLVGICVQDHGIGMTEQQLIRVCERFYRADTSGALPGTGLGMSIVKEIVELHHGKVEISSQYGQGTRVILWMPLDRRQNSKRL
ncbi:MAG: hypothetical protein B7Y16_08025 [Methylotenera sp. 24-45-7]|jgi:PAS domain S-box-containing protein|nr:MAG: hypothetical protein B7Y16_08025 [Methylotenera sp. 24-45-7]